ncbi:hypothetical protein NRF20_42470 [Streptomyces sp. R-74717]|uniref:hypothetical protein n=1 Tax=Streptomyces TaxID=1883 RepID=UPI00379F180D
MVTLTVPYHERQGERGFEDPTAAGITNGTVGSDPIQQSCQESALSSRQLGGQE